MFGRQEEICVVTQMAWWDFCYEWRLSAVQVFSLAAVLTPLLILFGLKFGLVHTIEERLIENPRNREIRPVGSGYFSAQWFETMSAREEVAFIMPKTRSISAGITLKQAGIPLLDAELIPTGKSDPLLASVGMSSDLRGMAVLLTEQAAQRLNAKKGDTVECLVTRRLNQEFEQVSLVLEIVGIVPNHLLMRSGIFANLELLTAVEAFRDGIAVPAFNWSGRPDPLSKKEAVYNSYRLFAATLNDVAILEQVMRKEGLEVHTNADDIDLMQKLNSGLSFIFWLLAIIGGAGYLLSLSASLWANIERKRVELGTIRLLGAKRTSLVWFPICQSHFVVFLGVVTASCSALAIAFLLNNIPLSALNDGAVVCRLLPEHFIMSIFISFFCSIPASIIACYRSMVISPCDGLESV